MIMMERRIGGTCAVVEQRAKKGKESHEKRQAILKQIKQALKIGK